LWVAAEKQHLELEMYSLREAYARKIADVELNCERLLVDRDTDKEAWFKKKKVEVAKIRAGVVVMQALFERRKKRFMAQMEEEKEQFEKSMAEMKAEVAQTKATSIETSKEYEARLVTMEQTHEAQLAKLLEELKTSTDLSGRAEQDLARSQQDVKRLHEVDAVVRSEIDDLQTRLQEAEKAEELQLRAEQVEALELELRRLKKTTLDRKHAEADALRRELMEYVKFIVKILPEEWRVRLQPELLQRVSEQSEQGVRSPELGGGNNGRLSPIQGGGYSADDMPPSPPALPPVHGIRRSNRGGLRSARALYSGGNQEHF